MYNFVDNQSDNLWKKTVAVTRIEWKCNNLFLVSTTTHALHTQTRPIPLHLLQPHEWLGFYVEILISFGTVWGILISFGTVWGILIRIGTVWGILISFGTVWGSLIRIGTVLGGFWLVLGQCGGFWLVLGQCGGFWLVLGQCGGLLMLNVPNNRYDVFALTIMLEIKIHNYVYKYLIQTIQYTWPTILFTDLLYCTVFISFSCTKCLSGCSPYQKNVFFSSLA